MPSDTHAFLSALYHTPNIKNTCQLVFANGVLSRQVQPFALGNQRTIQFLVRILRHRLGGHKVLYRPDYFVSVIRCALPQDIAPAVDC